MITHAQLENALSWETYRELLEQLLKQGKTTGLNQSDEYSASRRPLSSPKSLKPR
jgi:hypothetical protein